jgi:cytochrome c-type biogenesis protein
MIRPNSTFLHAVAFVLGFGLIFTLMGASVGLVGYVIYSVLPLVQQIGGVLLMLFGLVTMGVFGWLRAVVQGHPSWHTIGWRRALVHMLNFFIYLLYTERRSQMTLKGRGYVASFLTGVFFSAGWIPCVGPILAAILLLASHQQTVAQGTALLGVYSLGLGIPFLITGAAFTPITHVLRRLNRHSGVVSLISGLFLILVGWMLFTDHLRVLSGAFLGRFGLGLVAFENSLGIEGTHISFSLAFLAGLLSFFSPCVLPLIPGYLGYLSGASLAGIVSTSRAKQLAMIGQPVSGGNSLRHRPGGKA